MSSELILLRAASGPGCSTAVKGLLLWELIFHGADNFAVVLNVGVLWSCCDGRGPESLQKWTHFGIIDS